MMSRRLSTALAGLLVLFSALLGVTLVGGLGRAASADSVIDAAVAALSDTSPVYNDESAQLALTNAEVDQLTTQAQNAGTPLYAVVVPASTLTAYGDQAGVLRALLA